MFFWILAITITVFASAALYYAAGGRAVNAAKQRGSGVGTMALASHNRAQLAGIDEDLAAGRLAPDESVAAKAELARELIRQNRETGGVEAAVRTMPGFVPPVALLVIAVISFGTYWFVGNPGLPTSPLVTRTDIPASQLDLQAAVAEVEKRLVATPDDIRGWQVLAPVYLQSGRFEDAAHALRRILALAPPTADTETDLAEALMMTSNGSAGAEALALLRSAAGRDPNHVRARFYLAGEATEAGDFETAITRWTEVIGLAEGDEAWLETARAGLEFARNSGVPALAGSARPTGTEPGAQDREMIQAMVENLAGRLESDGGSIEEWTRLVRSYLVLGDTGAARNAYSMAKSAYPDPATRSRLDAIAAEANIDIAPESNQ